MSDETGDTAAPTGGGPAAAGAHIESARIRRAPKYGVFFLLGGALGVIASMIVTLTWNGSAARPETTAGGMTYSTMQVFGFALIYLVPIGVAVGAIVALVLDRVVGRRSRIVTVDREHVDDEPIDDAL